MKKKLPSESDDFAGLVGAETGEAYSGTRPFDTSRTGGVTDEGIIGFESATKGRAPRSGAVAPAKEEAKKPGRES